MAATDAGQRLKLIGTIGFGLTARVTAHLARSTVGVIGGHVHSRTPDGAVQSGRA